MLTDDGIIFISIDDHEIHNLRKICDEVFGEENYVGTIIWKNATDNNPTQIAVEHEYVICYAKNKSAADSVWKSKISDIKDVLIDIGECLAKQYDNQQDLQRAYNIWFKENKWQLWPLDRYKYIDKDGVYTGSQSVHNPGRGGYRYDIIHPVTGKPCKQPLMGYRFPESTMSEMLKEGKILFGKDHNKIVELKVYAKDYEDKLSSVFELDGRIGSYDMKDLFGEKPVFNNPKPMQLIKRLLSFIVDSDDIALDFFSGSATLAASIIDLNNIDNKSRRFICVQLPEDLDLNYISADAKAKATIKNAIEFLDTIKKPHKITEIGKERIRRAGKKILEENTQIKLGDEEKKPIDVGFKVFKLDTSSLKTWDNTPIKETQIDLFYKRMNDMIDIIKDDRTDMDVVYEVMLKMGVPLDVPVQYIEVNDKIVYIIGDFLLMIALFNDITAEDIEAIAAHAPAKIICAEQSFKDDSALSNAHYILKDKQIELKLV